MLGQVNSVTAVETESSEITTAINMIEHRISMVRTNVDRLENRLVGVLRPQGPQEADKSLKSIIHTPIGQLLHGYISQLDSILNQQHDIEKRLDI